MVAKYNDKIFLQTEVCKICDSSEQIEDGCIYNILTHQTPKCPLIRHNQKTDITEITNGILLIDTTERITILDSCENSKIITDPTIIELGNCTIKIRNFTFHGKNQTIKQNEYLVPIYGKPLQIANDPSIEEEYNLLEIKNLDKIKSIQLIMRSFNILGILGGTFLLVLTTISLLISYAIHRRTSSKLKKTAGIPELLNVQKPEDNSTGGTHNSLAGTTVTPVSASRLHPFKSQSRSINGLAGEALHPEVPPEGQSINPKPIQRIR